MADRLLHSIAAIAAALPLACGAQIPTLASAPPCDESTGFDASFLQISRDQLTFDTARWKQELGMLRELGVQLVIVQYSGDEHGPYDRGAHAPVAGVLAAASELQMAVVLGLHSDPSWPEGGVTRPAPPLDDPVTTAALGALCRRSSACVGWYMPQEIDDATWASPERAVVLRDHLARTSRTLRELAGNRPIMLAPYFTLTLTPADHAQWWRTILTPGTVDVVILQDGVGTGRATPELAGEYLAALRAVGTETGFELWSVVELFRQLHGAPVDALPFEATPIPFATLRSSMAIERELVGRLVAFSVLDYMDPRRGGAYRQLHDDYVDACRTARRPRSSP